jgi:hypothetical protein
MPNPPNLSGPHLDTLSHLFSHPTSHNIEWHDVLSLLEAVGTVKERHDGKYQVAIGPQSIVIERPLHKDIDISTVTELRRVLRNAGLDPDEQT